MKKSLTFVAGVIIGGLIGAAGLTYAAQSVFQVQQGGTGAQTFTSSGVLTGNGANPFYTTPTTTASCSGNASCTAFTIFGSSPVTISASAGATGSGNVATSTNETAGGLPYWTSTSGSPALVGQVATGTISGASVITTTSGRSAVGGALSITTTGGTFGSGNYIFPTDLTVTGNATTTDLAATLASTTKLVISNTGGSGTTCLQASGSGVVSSTGAACNTGTVTAVSVATANGFAGTSGGGSTPQLTLTTTITGILKGNGTAISAATPGSDYDIFAYPFTVGTFGVTNVFSTTTAAFLDYLGIVSATSTLGTLTASSSITDQTLGTPAGTFIAADPTGKLIATTSPSGGGTGRSKSYSLAVGTQSVSQNTTFTSTPLDIPAGTLTASSTLTLDTNYSITTNGSGGNMVINLIDTNGNTYISKSYTGLGGGAGGTETVSFHVVSMSNDSLSSQFTLMNGTGFHFSGVASIPTDEFTSNATAVDWSQDTQFEVQLTCPNNTAGCSMKGFVLTVNP